MNATPIGTLVDLEEYKADRIDAMLLEQEERDAACELEALRGLVELYDRGDVSATFVMQIARGKL